MPLRYADNGLPEKSGLYWKRGVIYVAIRVNEKKYVYCTRTDKPKEALDVKNAKIAELVTHEAAIAKKGSSSWTCLKTTLRTWNGVSKIVACT